MLTVALSLGLHLEVHLSFFHQTLAAELSVKLRQAAVVVKKNVDLLLAEEKVLSSDEMNLAVDQHPLFSAGSLALMVADSEVAAVVNCYLFADFDAAVADSAVPVAGFAVAGFAVAEIAVAADLVIGFLFVAAGLVAVADLAIDSAVDFAAVDFAAAKQAAAEGIKIFTIGIGSAAGSLIPIKNENGGSDFVRDERGKPVLSKLDEARLKEIAQVTGGFYEPFSSQAARTIVENGIVPLEAGTTGEMSARRPIERYEIPASVALLLLVLSILLKNGKSFFPRLSKRASLLACWIGIFMLGLGRVQATPGLQEYQQGNYEAALQNFEQRLQKIPSSP